MPDLEGIREVEQADRVFAALAHPARRQILLAVHYRGGCTAGEIAERFDCTWPTVSRHLAKLVAAGLLMAERRGRERIYTTDGARLCEVLQRWSDYFR